MQITIAIIIGILILVCIGYIIKVSNDLNRAKIKVEESASGIDVALTKRYDVLTKMIDTVKGYAKYEQETIFKTVELRKGMTTQEQNKVNELMEENMSKINLLVEHYPDIKANETYKTLQVSIADVEEHLQAARRLYNSNVSILNQKIATFPVSIIAMFKGLKSKEFFCAEEKKREDVKIDL